MSARSRSIHIKANINSLAINLAAAIIEQAGELARTVAIGAPVVVALTKISGHPKLCPGYLFMALVEVALMLSARKDPTLCYQHKSLTTTSATFIKVAD